MQTPSIEQAIAFVRAALGAAIRFQGCAVRPQETWRWRRPTLVEAMHVMALAVLTSAFAAAGWAFVDGPRAHAGAERRMAAEAEAENRDACRRLGMPPGGGSYAACAAELGRVRHQHEDRLARRSAGLL